ncbi:DNA polymerase III subunit delta' [Teredinibacter sp. KSP-S5-2]|uniref:DNA polymerase III subunit delta' n=1 Tax=Teredinibacter sp. KSP-S5-2 TaxID=3034506 RepID=UPI002934149F|nr:DNA polymerase III subunit delta' [Teredinibacter sp. KSP-S5-2]WNO10932.1 DNA polymerase III subunit delta' [Teredinibacter sp. KSP-S5-2]
MSNAILPMPPYRWQDKVWQEFIDNISADRLPHAMLLTGVAGTGVETLAIAMGQFLLCQSPMGKISCGRCKSCMLLSSGNHPDMVVISPEEPGKQIKVDEIRTLADFVGKTSQQGAKKIIVIHPADALNINAANALLKNLEEPAGDTVFLLVSSSLSQVLPTIRSRCLKLVLPLPEKHLAEEWLKSVHVEQPGAILEAAGGAPLLAKSWADSEYLQERQKLLQSLVALSLSQTTPIETAKVWAKVDLTSIISNMLYWVEKMIKIRLADEPLAELSELEQAFEGAESGLLFRLRDNLAKKRRLVQSSSNLNPTLILEELMLDWAAVIRLRASSMKSHAGFL